MSGIITFIVIVMIVGIIYLNRPSPKAVKTRQAFLDELSKFVSAPLQPMEESENTYRLDFVFEGHSFSFEDVLSPGFQEKVHKAYLKMQIPGDLSLYFQENTQSAKAVSANNLNLFNKAENTSGVGRLRVPDKFSAFTVNTNNTERVNKIFSNHKFVNILSNYSNVDSRGYHFMAIKIMEGLLILEFFHEARYIPNIVSLKKNVHLIEDYLKDLINLYKIFQQYP